MKTTRAKLTVIASVMAMMATECAFADIQPGNTTSGATGGELLFYAFDDVTKTSYVKDLGRTYASYLASPFIGSTNISSDTNWANYLDSVGGNTSNTYWGVFASEKTSALSANGVNILTTARNNSPLNTSTTLVRGIDGAMNISYLGSLQGSSSNYAENISYFSSSTGSDNWANGPQHNLFGRVNFNADNLIGQNASVYRLSAASIGTTNATLSTVNSYGFGFDGTTIYSGTGFEMVYFYTPLTPPGTTITFADQVAGVTGNSSLKIVDYGDVFSPPLMLFTAKITGPDADKFSLGNFAPGMTIAGTCNPGRSCDPSSLNSFNLDLLFRGDAPGTYNATLTFETNSLGAANFSYGLTATIPVPEPESYAMLLAGLFLISVAGRGKNQRNLRCQGRFLI